jgi:hypothetical protein
MGKMAPRDGTLPPGQKPPSQDEVRAMVTEKLGKRPFTAPRKAKAAPAPTPRQEREQKPAADRPGGTVATPAPVGEPAGDAGKEPGPVEAPLRLGSTPTNADPVTVRAGVVFIGKYEALDFESGDPVTVPDGATDEVVREALKKAGAVPGKAKFFGGADAKARKNVAREPEAPYETDLFGEALPAPQPGAEGAQPRKPRVRRDAQPAAAVQPGDAAADAAGEFYVETYVRTPTLRKLGADRIKNPGDLAAATHYLYESAVERFDAIVTDKSGKPLAVVGSFKGALSQASVYPAVLMAEALRVPGAAEIWFSHNHPSGKANLSDADIRLNTHISDVFRGSGIKPMGLVAVSNGRYHYHHETNFQGDTFGPQNIPEGLVPRKTVEVPVYELGQRDERQVKRTLGSPAEAKLAARDFYERAKEDGLLLLDAQNAVSGWLPLAGMTGKLRDTGGLEALYRAISRSNAAAAILVHGTGLRSAPGQPPNGTILNVGKALFNVDVRLLDAVTVDTSGYPALLTSAAERGESLVGNTLYALSEADPRLAEALARYDDTGESTGRDLLADVQFLISEGVVSPELAQAAERYEAEIRENETIFAGRGDEQGEEEAFAEAVRQELARGRAQFARGERSGGVSMQELRGRIDAIRGMGKDEVQAIVDSMTASWKAGPKVHVVGTWRELPARFKATAQVRGVHSMGEAWIVAAAHRTGDDVRHQVGKTLAHEVVAHYGLRQILGDDFDKLLTKPMRLAVTSGNKAMIQLRDEVRHLYRSPDGSYNLTASQEADEMAARAVEQAVDADGKFRTGYSWLKAVWARVAQFLRDLGINVQFTTAELHGMLVLAMRGLEQGHRFDGGAELQLQDAAAARGEAQEARAFHGTPHRFDRFSTDHVGNGEGAQAYGWGLYFAEKRAIAEHYRKGVSEQRFIQLMREAYDEFESPNGAVEVLRESTELSPEQLEVMDALQADDWLGFDYPHQALRAALREPENFEISPRTKEALEKLGRLYQVEVPEDDELLLWDKPLAEQPEKVRAALQRLAADMGAADAANHLTRAVKDGLKGEVIYRHLAQEMAPASREMDGPGPRGWGGFTQTLNDQVVDMRAASLKLRELGVRGIKYLDEQSRRTGMPRAKDHVDTHNFVIFDGDDVQITAQFALADTTDSEAFRRWFGDSKVVDAEGKPLVVYHGTTMSVNPSEREDGHGIWFAADPSTASIYATARGEFAAERGEQPEPQVQPAYLSMQNPMIVDARGARYDEIEIGNTNWETDTLLIEARERGHDGLIVRNVRDLAGVVEDDEAVDIVYAVFRPEQIKSAIGNRGTFDPADPDVRFAMQDDMFASPEWTAPDDTLTDKVLYELQDGRIDLKRVQQAIAGAGREIEEKFDARLRETLYPGRVARRAELFLQREVKPLLKAMAVAGVAQDELGDYLLARFAPDRNRVIAQRNPDLPDGGAGRNSHGELMTNDAARAYLEAIPKERRADLEELAAAVDKITAGTRNLLVAEGLEKRDTVDGWQEAWGPFYVPLFKDEAEQGGHPHPIGSGFTVRGPSSKSAVGSTRTVTNVLAHVLMQREAAITRGEKNRVGLSLYGLALANPNRDFWTTIRPSMSNEAIGHELEAMGVDPDDAVAGMQRVPTITMLDPTTGKVVSRPNPLYKSLPGAIVVRLNGEDRVLLLNTRNERAARMAADLKNLDGLTKLNLAGSVVGKATRWLAAVNTQYNPAFGLVNLTRDTWGGLVNLGSTPLRGRGLKVLADVPKAMVGITRGLVSRGQSQAEWPKLWEQFQADGGRTGYRDMFAVAEERAQQIEKELLQAKHSGALRPANVGRAVLRLLDGFNETLENSVRLAAYKEGLDKGLSRAQAARLARELTVDFNRKGRGTRELSPLYAFFNAAVQGGARTVETLKGPTGRYVIAGGLALGVIQALLLLVADYDDDEIPDWVKTRSLIIPLGKDAKGEKRFVQVPYPLGLHVLPNTGRVLTELTLSGGKDWGKKLASAIGEIGAAFNPLGGGDITTAHGALTTIAPTLVDPIVDIVANKNFSGQPIEREPYGGERDNRPGFQRARERTQREATGQAYIGITRTLNQLTGGSDYERGLVSMTPERLRYITQTIGGGVLRETEKAINASVQAMRGEDVKPSAVPVFGRFYGEVDEDSVAKNRYREKALKVDKVESSLRAAKGAGDGEAVSKMLEAHPEAMLIRAQNQVQQRLNKLNRLAVATVGDPAEMKMIDEARVQAMREFNDAVLELEGAAGPTPAQRLKKVLRPDLAPAK